MNILGEKQKGIQALDLDTSTYTSRMIPAYLAWLSKRSSTCILDLGPVCDTTINFFLPHIQKFFTYDLFLRITRYRDIRAALKELHYAQGSFDAVHLWDVIDRMDDHTISPVIDVCHSLLKSGGSLIAVAYNEQTGEPALNSFAVTENSNIVLKPQSHLNFPFYHRNNQTILNIMKPFTLYNSYIYRCGIREFYFRR